jgi:hypothetical protein
MPTGMPIRQTRPETRGAGRAAFSVLMAMTLAACGPDATGPVGHRMVAGRSTQDVSTVATTTLWDQSAHGTILIGACVGTLPSTVDWAADIVVPNGGWVITGVRPVSSLVLSGLWTGSVSVRADDAGRPGELLASSAVTWVNDVITQYTPAANYILTSPITLGSGKYWLVFQDLVCLDLKPAAEGDGTFAYIFDLAGWRPALSGAAQIPSDLRFALEGTSQQPVAEAVESLADVVTALGLADGTTTSLGAKMRAAVDALDAGNTEAACRALQDFINQTTALAGKKLTTAQADALIGEATGIRTVLGCT